MAYDYSYGLGLGPPIAGAMRVTSGVGPRKSFATSGGQRSSSDHPGVDLGTPVGTALLAPFDGTIIHVVNKNDGTEKRNQKGYGNMVVVRRDDGTIAQMSHLHSASVKVGDRVSKGQQIGQTGNSGSSTGPHLDYIVVNANGKALRPDGTEYRNFYRPYFGNKVTPNASTGLQPTQEAIAAMPPVEPTGSLNVAAPQFAATEVMAQPKTSWLDAVEKEAAYGEILMGSLAPRLPTPSAADKFFTGKEVLAALPENVLAPRFTAGVSYNGY